jgi:hypothetical protein
MTRALARLHPGAGSPRFGETAPRQCDRFSGRNRNENAPLRHLGRQARLFAPPLRRKEKPVEKHQPSRCLPGRWDHAQLAGACTRRPCGFCMPSPAIIRPSIFVSFDRRTGDPALPDLPRTSRSSRPRVRPGDQMKIRALPRAVDKNSRGIAHEARICSPALAIRDDP